MSPSIFEFWTSLHKVMTSEECKERMLKAKNQLTSEIEEGIRRGTTEEKAEIMLLEMLIK
jgi:hypothetical protein